MAQATTISWTDARWNPWQGCHKVSPGCAHCYMFTWQRRYGKGQDVVIRSAPATVRAPLRWQRQMGQGTYTGARHGTTLLVFTCSLSDFFLEEADAWRGDVWEIIRSTPNLTYQILTKRPELIMDRLPSDWGEGYQNCWIGVSVENQRWRSRLERLRTIPAVVRFASFEPILGDLGSLALWLPMLDWAIVGGESGAGHRPMALPWLHSVVTQCQAAGVPVWVK